jgi:hypothetical protein
VTPQRLVVIVLAIAMLVITAPIVAGGRTWSDVRYHTEIAPARIAAAEAVQSGALPGWWEGTGLGVPLAAEPSHGALYPLHWAAGSLRALDWMLVLHLVWLAIGVALCARRRGASEQAVFVIALMTAACGLMTSTALRGALPAIAQLPWIGWAAASLDQRGRSIVLAFALGLVGLAGQLGTLVDAVLIAALIGGRRAIVPIVCGLAIASIQWLPAALTLGESAGDVVRGIPPRRFLDLVVPRIGESWAPSMFVGAPLLALAAVRTPERRGAVLIGALALLAIVVGRGGWPAWLGAPETHLAALVIVLAIHAASGLDDVLAGQRRARIVLMAGVTCTGVALVAMAALRMRRPTEADAIERALVYGGISLACAAGAIAVRVPRVTLALLLLSTVTTVPSIPTVHRANVAEPHPLAIAAQKHTSRAPLRIFRPVYMTDGPLALDEAMATLAGASPSLWGLAAARSEDPGRPKVHDRTWLAAAREGGALLDRFGIELVIVPETVVSAQKFQVLATRGTWSLVKLPVAPPASVLRGWMWSRQENAFELMYPLGGGMGVLRGSVVLEGTGEPGLDRGPPLPCVIDRWDPGAIDVTCTGAGYAAVSSSPARGWSATVDDRDVSWLRADLLRRAVHIEAGTHRIAWRYAIPGLPIALGLAALAVLALAIQASFGKAARRARTSDPASRETT